jgi:Xaa-Pro aminopeptidase
MLTRRQLLQSSALGAGALVVPAGCQKQGDPQLLQAHVDAGKLLRDGPLLNFERAYKVMHEEGLDGLVVTRPRNFFYFTGYNDQMALRIGVPSSFALLARDESKGPGIVISQFIYYYSYVDGDYKWPGETYLFTGWDGKIESESNVENRFDVEPKARDAFFFNDRGELPERDFETNRLQKLKATLEDRGPIADAEWALVKAAREMGLDKGRIGVDDAVIAGIYDAAGFAASTVDADHAIRRIRMVKSASEIELMRVTARMNAAAALAAVKSVREGATHKELRAEFYSEASKRGQIPYLLQVDTVTSEIYDAELRDGAAFAIDAVSAGHHYLGDYGRTVFLGEPSKAMKRATDAISVCWDAVRERLKPGLRYSEIRQIGRDAIKSAGYDYAVAVTPHSVGLTHTDEPGRNGPGAFWVKDDLVLEENMIISVDLPVLHTGIGGSAHLEDLTLITSDGGVQINDVGDRIIIV